ncbi:MAG: sorbosone dehydrogenase [Solirubrobacterales bacterium]|nr:sorbosone dehydrogenase [Solirubrobacterales bacterium]
MALAGCGGSGANSSHSSALVSIGAGLNGPTGLRASVYAKGPSTTAAFAFDAQGRLWLTAAGLEAHTHDGVYVIAKQGAKPVEVVSGLDDPLGLAWYGGRLYVASVGRVDAYAGFDGRRFTQHTRILDGPVAGGENNLLAMSSDGRFLMGITATCDHCTPSSRYSGSIVSFRPDGSGLRLYASRIRAPFGLAYMPGTSDLFVSMNQQDDLGRRTPGDWLTLVREGQDWRFPGCYGQGGSSCAGVPSPTAVLDEHAAVGGVAIATGELGASVGTAAIVPEWQLGKVQRVALRRTGSGYEGSVTPLLTGIENPLAITIAPDRSLLVGDWATGTIYRVAPRSR